MIVAFEVSGEAPGHAVALLGLADAVVVEMDRSTATYRLDGSLPDGSDVAALIAHAAGAMPSLLIAVVD